MNYANVDLDEWKSMETEALDPELEPWVEESTWGGKMLRHPLVYEVPLLMPGMANRRFAYKRDALNKALAASEYSSAVFLHERAYRLDALYAYVLAYDEDGEVLPLWSQDAKTVDLALEVWVDSENISQNRERWSALFTGRPNESRVLGTPEEREAFDELPSEVRVYRGGDEFSFLSWTTDRAVAEKFAARFGSTRGYEVHERVIKKSSIFAYLTRRGESEVLTWEGTTK